MQRSSRSDCGVGRAEAGRAGFDEGDWSALAELVGDAVLVSRDGEIVHANGQAARLLTGAQDVEPVLGRRLDEWFEVRGVGSLIRDARDVVACRTRCQPERGSLQLRTAALADGHLLHVVVDMHDQERAQEALLDVSRDLVAVREELAAVQQRFQESVAERQELVNVVCHELRTPITVVRGYAKLLLAEEVGTLNDDQRRFVEESARSCVRLDDFVELLLRATSEERAAMDHLVEADAPLRPLLEGAVEYLRPLLEERGVEVELELAPDALWARFDAARVEQVIANLLSNALEYASGSRAIRIHTRRVANARDGEARLEIGITDAGPGVAPELREAIFDPYFRGSASCTDRGLGLGLAICRRIVEAHGGSIAVRPAGVANETGSCFAFTLPAVDPKPGSLDSDPEDPEDQEG